MTAKDVREVKENLNLYIRRAEAGERIAITVYGRVVAELVPPSPRPSVRTRRFDELVASGVIRRPLEPGDRRGRWPDIGFPRGVARRLIDADRDEA